MDEVVLVSWSKSEIDKLKILIENSIIDLKINSKSFLCELDAWWFCSMDNWWTLDGIIDRYVNYLK